MPTGQHEPHRISSDYAPALAHQTFIQIAGSTWTELDAPDPGAVRKARLQFQADASAPHLSRVLGLAAEWPRPDRGEMSRLAAWIFAHLAADRPCGRAGHPTPPSAGEVALVVVGGSRHFLAYSQIEPILAEIRSESIRRLPYASSADAARGLLDRVDDFSRSAADLDAQDARTLLCGLLRPEMDAHPERIGPAETVLTRAGMTGERVALLVVPMPGADPRLYSYRLRDGAPAQGRFH